MIDRLYSLWKSHLVMKKFAILSLLLCGGFASGQVKTELTDVDRQLLLEQMQKILDASKSNVSTRLSTALNAYRAALTSDAATHELYIKCVEKVLFQDEAKKAKEFRNWKKSHKDRRDTPSFRRALRYQLRWLVLMIETATDPEAKKNATKRALSVMNEVLSDHEKLDGSAQVLRGNPMSSVFATAYDMNSVKSAQFPQSPLDIAGIYEGLVFPDLRESASFDKLKAAWLKRIELEGGILQKLGTARDQNGDKGRRPEFEKWYYKTRPNLIWEMERDLFKSGDERGASLRMLKFLEKNFSHTSAPKWIDSFTNLVKGEEEKVPQSSKIAEGSEPEKK